MKTTIVAAALWLLPGSVWAGGLADLPPASLADIAWPLETYGTLAPGPPQDPQPASQDPQKDTDQDTPAAVAAETRGFLSTLGHNLLDDVKHLPRRNSVYWAAGGGALAWAVHPADTRVNRHFRGSDTWDNIFVPGKIIGETSVQVAASLATYGVGRWRGNNNVRHLGMDLMEAQLLTEGIVEALKVAVRRERPPNPDGSPQTGTFSFPSGHAAVTFAGATVLQQHLGWKAAVPTYLVASYVALSRLHDNRHYLSDIVFGATTGIIVGRSVTYHGRNNYPVQPAVGPNFLGVTVEWR